MNQNHNIAAARLASLVQRIERLEEERKSLAADIKDIYTEAKSDGFDTRVMRALIAERKKDASEAEDQRALLDVYRSALGQLDGTPLADAAMHKAGLAPL